MRSLTAEIAVVLSVRAAPSRESSFQNSVTRVSQSSYATSEASLSIAPTNWQMYGNPGNKLTNEITYVD
jgi:hypothetical protein